MLRPLARRANGLRGTSARTRVLLGLGGVVGVLVVGYHVRCDVLAEVADFLFAEMDLAFENLAAQRVDTLALLVHHVVVFEQVLADGEVLRFHLFLRALDGA